MILNVIEMERFEGWMPDFLGKNLFFNWLRKEVCEVLWKTRENKLSKFDSKLVLMLRKGGSSRFPSHHEIILN